MDIVSLIGKEMVAEGTMLFKYTKPAGFVHRAGQSIDLTLIEPSETDTEGNMRAFSLVSAPHEEFLATATRLRDTAFKRVLRDLPLSTEVQIDGPFGSFFLHDNYDRPAVFLVGGIGVTPFYSIAKDAAHRHLPHHITMLYSNRRPEDATFLQELQALTTENRNFKLVPTITDINTSASGWAGERGLINEALVKKYMPKGQPVYYLAGPQKMVTAMRALLTGMGVSNDDIRFEEFTGY